jgi:hypothetical protein
MALSGSGSSSYNTATDQWFFNLANNSSSLDSQKFTVFGQVVNSSSLGVIDAIAGEPIDTTHASPNSALPEISLAAGLTANNLIYVNSITPLSYPAPTITLSKPSNNSHFNLGQTVQPVYSCDDAGGPGLASCTGPKTVDTTLFGTFKYTVTATDSAGDTATKSVSYTVVPYFIPKPPKPRAPILSPPYHTDRRGDVSVGLLCAAKVRCTGKLRLFAGHKHKLVGVAGYSIAQGHTIQLTLRLNKTGRRLLSAGHRRLQVAVALTPSGKHSHTTKHKLTLKAS